MSPKFLLAFLLGLATSVGVSHSAKASDLDDDLKMLPKETTGIMHVDYERLYKSEFMKAIEQDVLPRYKGSNQEMPKSYQDISKLMSRKEYNFIIGDGKLPELIQLGDKIIGLESIDKFTSTGTELILRGRFNQKKTLQVAKCESCIISTDHEITTISHKSFVFNETKEAKPMEWHMRFLDDRTIVCSYNKNWLLSVKIPERDTKPVLSQELLDRIKNISPEACVWETSPIKVESGLLARSDDGATAFTYQIVCNQECTCCERYRAADNASATRLASSFPRPSGFQPYVFLCCPVAHSLSFELYMSKNNVPKDRKTFTFKTEGCDAVLKTTCSIKMASAILQANNKARAEAERKVQEEAIIDAMPTDVMMLPKETELIATIDFERLYASPLAKTIGFDKVKAAIRAEYQEEQSWKEAVKVGIDPSDCERITTGAWNEDEVEYATVLRGDFDAEKIVKAAEHEKFKVIENAGKKTIEIPSPRAKAPDRKVYLRVLSGVRIVCSTNKEWVNSVKKPADEDKPVLTKELIDLVIKVNRKAFAWFATTHTRNIPGNLPGKVKSFIGQAIIKDELSLMTHLEAENKEVAVEIAKAFREQIGLLSLLAIGGADFTDSTEGHVAIVRIKVSQKEVEAYLQSMRRKAPQKK